MQSFKLGEFLVEPSKGTISSSNKTVKIEPKAMLVLCELKKQSGEVVAHESLFEKVWPGRVYSPSSLQRIIALLRKALNETSQSPKHLHTHSKLGYRLEGVVELAATISTEGTEKLRKERNKRRFLPVVLLIVTILFILAIVNDNNKYESSTTYKLVSHGESEEFLPKLSPDGQWLSYQSMETVNKLHLIALPGLSKRREIPIEGKLIDHIWRDSKNILFLERLDNGDFRLVQTSGNQAGKGDFTIINHFKDRRSMQQLTMLNDSTMLFAARSDNFQLIKFDLISNQVLEEFELSQDVLQFSLAVSPNGIFLHHYDGTRGYLSLLKNNTLVTINVPVPDIANIVWDEVEAGLIISNQMLSEQLIYRDNKISPINLSNNEVLTHLTTYKNLVAATQKRKDMDIVAWSQDQLIKVVDSKYEDYQAAANNNGDLAFVSSRRGRPQILIKSQSGTQVLFENMEGFSYLSPPIWSPEGNALAFTAEKRLFVSDIGNGGMIELTPSFDVQSVLNWQDTNLLYVAAASGVVFEYNQVSNTFVAIDEKLSTSFLAKDSFGQFLGVRADHLFWGDKVKSISSNIHFASYFENSLIVQLKSNKENLLHVYDNQLNLTRTVLLPTDCHYVTSIQSISHVRTTYCTQLQTDDNDIVLITRT